ncbi:endonuclease/exonuclease/phosphatase family protein [Propylenella binzhouense]|nr:endonuclease/exonuclease/phosphatase family protein [Propylenella binzhouense]
MSLLSNSSSGLETMEPSDPAASNTAPARSGGTRAAAAASFSIATYNIHSCVGLDGRREPERVAEVLHELDADVVALQEVDSRRLKTHGHWIDQFAYLAELTGYEAVPGPNVVDHSGSFGNVLLSRFPVRRTRAVDLTFSTWREPRGAIDAELALGSRRLRVVATHLGLTLRERNAQVAQLMDVLLAEGDETAPCVLLGDLNEWRPRGGSLRPLMGELEGSPQRATFPTWRPLLPLDRIFARNAWFEHVEAHRSARSRIASDHLPLKAICRWTD